MDLQYLSEIYEPTRIVGKKQHLLESSFFTLLSHGKSPTFPGRIGLLGGSVDFAGAHVAAPEMDGLFQGKSYQSMKDFFWGYSQINGNIQLFQDHKMDD